MKLLMKDYFSNTRKEFDVDLPCIQGLSAAKQSERCRGFYAEVSDKTIGMAEYGERLYVMLDKRMVEADESLSVHYSDDGRTRKLIIAKGADRWFVDYVNDNDPVSTPFYSESEEDADFGLWLSNILSSPERKRNVLSWWTSNDL